MNNHQQDVQKVSSDWFVLENEPVYTFSKIMPEFDRYWSGYVMILGIDIIWSFWLRNKFYLYARSGTDRFHELHRRFSDGVSIEYLGEKTTIKSMKIFEEFYRMMTANGEIVWVYKDDLDAF